MSINLTLIVLSAMLAHPSAFCDGRDTRCAAGSKASHPACCAAQQEATPAQVQLRVMMVEIARGKLEGLGFKFSPTKRTLQNYRGFCSLIRALAEERLARVMCEPTLATYSGQPATLAIVGDSPIAVRLQDGTFVFQSREHGVRLKALPEVLEDGCIHLKITHGLSEIADEVTAEGISIPGLETTSVSTSVTVRAGETTVIGGMITKETPAPTGAEPQEKEIIVAVTANLIENPGSARGGEAELIAPPLPADSSAVIQPAIIQAVGETDAEGPHPPAGCCATGRPCPGTSAAGTQPGCRDGEAEVYEWWTRRIFSKRGSDERAGRPGSAGCEPGLLPSTCCREGCSTDRGADQDQRSSCCNESAGSCDVEIELAGDEDGDDEQESAAFIEELLGTQLESLQQLFWARLEHERDALRVRAAAEGALARQQVEHQCEMMESRIERLTELQEAREAAWGSERRAMEVQHRQALQHEREMAELREEHLKEAYGYEQRIAALEYQHRLAAAGSQSALRDRTGKAEPPSYGSRVPVQVEDLLTLLGVDPEEAMEKARLVKGLVARAERDLTLISTPEEADEEIETAVLDVPAACTHRPDPSEVERLRREVARLRALVEDLLCVAPESPPVPVPQNLPE